MPSDFPAALLNLTLWDQLSPKECKHLARYIEAYLPPTFRFSRIATYKIGTQRRHIAHFDWQPSPKQAPGRFSLIPGATTTLGFERAQAYAVDAAFVLDWQQYCLAYEKGFAHSSEEGAGDPLFPYYKTFEEAFAHSSAEIKRDPSVPHYEAFSDYLAHILHPVRTVTLPPLLVEVNIQEAKRVMPQPLLTYFRYYHKAIKREVTHINHQGHCSIPQRHVLAFLRKDGFRLLTPDEWEYICAAGSRALFYWENTSYKPDKHTRSWMALRNTFGLSMVKDTYQWEYVADPSIMAGGDGGWAECGGAHLFAQSIPRASAYHIALNDKRINQGVYSPCFRRAYDLKHIFRTEGRNEEKSKHL